MRMLRLTRSPKLSCLSLVPGEADRARLAARRSAPVGGLLCDALLPSSLLVDAAPGTGVGTGVIVRTEKSGCMAIEWTVRSDGA